MAKVDLRNRAPMVERLPDSRLRVTRTADTINYVTFTPAALLADVWLAWGTADPQFTACRLIKQELTGQHPAGTGMRGDPGLSPERHPSILKRIYEEIDASLETLVGNADVEIGQDGLTTVKQESIQFSTGTAIYAVPGTSVAPAPWGACVLKDEQRTDDGTIRIIKRTYINQGLISQDDQIHNEGALLIRSLTYVNQVPPTPAGFTLINQRVQFPNGNPVYSYTFAKGIGIIDKRIQQRDGGLRLETWISLGTSFDAGFMQPAGVMMMKDEEFLDGHNRYVVTSMQNYAGGDPTSGTALTFKSKHPFRYPGRAKAYRKNVPAIFGSNSAGIGSFTCAAYDVFRSPPVDVEVDCQVDISYQTDNTLTLGTTFWNPDSWATVEAYFQPTGTIAAKSVVESLFGYRAINSGTAILFTAGSTIISFGPGTIDVSAYVTSCMGTPVYGLSSGQIVVSGGPTAPDGITWIISAKLEEAFVGLDGTRYFRRTQVSSTIPSQPALPV